MRESNWHVINICSSCRQKLSTSQEFYSRGICPKCGNNSYSTICNTYKIIYKIIKHYKWWEFWKTKVTYKGKNKVSIDWLKINNL